MSKSRGLSRTFAALAAVAVMLSAPAAQAQQQDWRGALQQIVHAYWIGGGTVTTAKGQAEVVCEGYHSLQPGQFVRIIQKFSCRPSFLALAHGQPLTFAPFTFAVWSDTTDGATIQGAWWEQERVSGRFRGAMSAIPYPHLTATIQVQGDGGRTLSASYVREDLSLTASSPAPGISQMSLRMYRSTDRY